MATTLESLTEKQIRSLREEALGAGDYQMVDICQRALTRDSQTIDADGNNMALAEMPQSEARYLVVEAIRSAEAQQD